MVTILSQGLVCADDNHWLGKEFVLIKKTKPATTLTKPTIGHLFLAASIQFTSSWIISLTNRKLKIKLCLLTSETAYESF
jgi:hypothetical protein